jgi:16S rRNA (cytosine967-C5)-methyltransferase
MAGFYKQHLVSAIDLIKRYPYKEPFAIFLKNHFKKDKKFGSRDRKSIADLCYGYMRLGKSADEYTIQDQIIIGFFLTHQEDNGLLENFSPLLKHSVDENLEKKIEIISESFPLFNSSLIFSFHQYISTKINLESFGLSHLKKPLFFIKIRGEQQVIIQMLEEKNVAYASFGDKILGFEQHVNLSDLFKLDRDIVVQDISSQHTINLLDKYDIKSNTCWDACAGSGGKSILASDRYHFTSHYVSDIRPSILEELTERLSKANIKLTDAFCVDLTNSLSIQVAKSHLPSTGVELIIADVPCTGSGTWGRSPEWLRSFEEEQIEVYQQKQIQIVKNILPFLKKDGYLLYITCSIFANENEAVLEAIKNSHPIKVLEQKYFIGFPNRGDQLFAALITL